MAAVPPIYTPPHSSSPTSSRSAASTRATPKDSQLKAAVVGKRVFRSPPQVSRINKGMAPTPAGKRMRTDLLERRSMAPLGNRIVHRPSFPGEKLTVETPLSPLCIPNAPFSIGTIYNDGETPRNIIQQAKGTKSCWAYSFAMLLTDAIRSGKDLSLDEGFRTWFGKASLLNADQVQGEAERLGLPLTFTNIPQKNPLDTIKRQLETSGFPVLVTIEHPIYSGHAIVIDKISDTHTTVRDPADGKAFVVPNDKMQSYFKDQEEGESDDVESLEEQKCLSVTPPTPHGAAGL